MLIVVLATLVYSSAVFVQSSVWVFREPLVPTSGAYVYTYWIGAGAALWGLARLGGVDFSRDWAATASALSLSLFACWMLLSAFWSIAPTVTPLAAMLMVATLGVGVWLGRGPTAGELTVGLFLGCQALVVMSAIYVALTPRGVYLTQWVGVFASRNSLGPIATFGLMLWLALAQQAFRHLSQVAAVGYVSLAVFDVVVSVGARSSTSIVALLAAVAVLGAGALSARAKSTGMRFLLPGAMVAGAVGVATALAWPAVAAAVLGRDTSFSDRRVIWDYLVATTSGRFDRGFGYSAFWTDADLVYPLYELTGSVYDSAHSTFVEVYVAGGLVAVATLVAAAAIAVFRISRWWIRTGDPAAATWAAMLAFCLVENTSESMITYHSIFWLLVIAATFAAGNGAPSGPPGPSDGHT